VILHAGAASAFVQAQGAARSAGALLQGPTTVALPEEARAALRALKDAAPALLDGTFAALSTLQPGCEESLSHAALASLTRLGVAVGAFDDPLGTVVGLRVTTASTVVGARRWLVTLSLGVPCGADEQLYVLTEGPRGVELAISVASPDFLEITGAQDAIVAALSPGDSPGGAFLVTAHAEPWCSSGLRNMRVRALAFPGPRAVPDVLFEGRAAARLDDSLAQVDASSDGFSVRFVSWATIGPGRTRPHVWTYRRSGARFVRVAPRVQDPSDLPDEWLRLPWAEAKLFSGEGTALETWHARLRAALARRGSKCTLERSGGGAAGRGGTVVQVTIRECGALPPGIQFVLSTESERVREIVPSG
jgi:hypothetical protein